MTNSLLSNGVRNTWDNKDAYDSKVLELAERFKKNFEEFAPELGVGVLAAGPK